MSDPEQVAPIDSPEEHLAGLDSMFMAAIAAREAGDIDRAIDLLTEVLRREPRLAEPRLEFGRILLDAERLEDAEDHTREALAVLEAGGQWVEEIAPEIVLSVALSQLAEILRQRADSDEIIFGDPAVFKAMLRESQQLFERARTLDPSNEHAGYHAFFLGLDPDGDVPELPDGDVAETDDSD